MRDYKRFLINKGGLIFKLTPELTTSASFERTQELKRSKKGRLDRVVNPPPCVRGRLFPAFASFDINSEVISFVIKQVARYHVHSHTEGF